MSDQPDSLQFRLPSHPEAVLSRMNALREERHFCDITLLLRGPLGATEKLSFHGHKVVLAAASDFLRDQFLLHDGRAELAVGVVTDVEVGERLLLSCYTGVLEVPRCELVTYLTAASALQMSRVVEKCAQAISLHFSPAPENTSKEEEIQQTQGANATLKQKAIIDPQMGEVDYENAICCLKVLELESNIMTNDNWKHVGLSNAKFELHSPANGTTSTNREYPNEDERLLDSLPDKDDGKGELNSTTEEPVAEHEIAVPLDTPTQSTVKADRVDNRFPKSYLCQQCDHVFQRMDHYVQHIKDHHYYQCLVCKKSFPQKIALSRHVRVHSPVKPYRCPLCHSTFPNKASLQYHINLHIGKPHKCNYCTAQFNLKPGPRRHLKDTHEMSNLENVLEEDDC
ncbi:zinc finger and BTB domain-containing protein 26-like [Eucyclogobius newberryi]|uniref:zinc finger and BTB domain-containing protein 26-like n=1 Tax=Eucyclogobius newberryi TaxID=166745 RepID=UPI003B5B408C